MNEAKTSQETVFVMPADVAAAETWSYDSERGPASNGNSVGRFRMLELSQADGTPNDREKTGHTRRFGSDGSDKAFFRPGLPPIVSGAAIAQLLPSRPPSPDPLEEKQAQVDAELFRDRVFTQEDWEAHVSFRRYLVEPIILLRLCITLAYPITCVFLVALACAVYEEAVRDSDWPSLHNLEASFAYSLCSFALSLLLIFKTNSSYSRFWEARTAWGNVYGDCRTFILKMQVYAPEAEPAVRKALMRWTIALPYIMRSHLLDYVPGSDSLEELLTAREVAWLRLPRDGTLAHQPNKAAAALMALLIKSDMPEVDKMDATNTLKAYISRVVTCERIQSTPIPMPYTRHTTRFILVYTFFMPLVLWKHLEWSVFVIAPLITLLLAGIDNIGIHIENPIMILPMLSYCRSIHHDIIDAAHDWACDTGKDALSVITESLAEEAPPWQMLPADHLPTLQACGGSINDSNAPLHASPAAYRISFKQRSRRPSASLDGSSESSRRALRANRSSVRERPLQPPRTPQTDKGENSSKLSQVDP